MDTQELFNAALSLINLLVGFFLKMIWDSIADLKRSNADLIKEMASIHILVAGEYVKRDYFEKKVDALFTKLDKIQLTAETRLDKGN